MASAKDVKAGSAYVLLYGKDNLLSKALQNVSKKLHSIGAAGVGGLAIGFSMIGAAIAKILSPMGLLTIGAAALAVHFLDLRKIGDAIKETFANVAAETSDTLSAIGHALAAGDLKAAMGVLSAYLDLEWQRALNTMRDAWDGFTAAFNEAIIGVGVLFVKVGTTIQSVWMKAMAGIKAAYSDFLRGLGRPELADLVKEQEALVRNAIAEAQTRIQAGEVAKAWDAIETARQTAARERLAGAGNENQEEAS